MPHVSILRIRWEKSGISRKNTWSILKWEKDRKLICSILGHFKIFEHMPSRAKIILHMIFGVFQGTPPPYSINLNFSSFSMNSKCTKISVSTHWNFSSTRYHQSSTIFSVKISRNWWSRDKLKLKFILNASKMHLNFRQNCFEYFLH